MCGMMGKKERTNSERTSGISARSDKDVTDGFDRVRPPNVSTPRAGWTEHGGRTLEREHDVDTETTIPGRRTNSLSDLLHQGLSHSRMVLHVLSIWTRCQIVQMRQDHWTSSDQGNRNKGRPLSIESSDVSPSVSDFMLNSAIESASRNRMLDLGRTTCRRFQLEPPPEQGHSRTHEGSPHGLFVGVWYSLVPDYSETVDDVDFNISAYIKWEELSDLFLPVCI